MTTDQRTVAPGRGRPRAVATGATGGTGETPAAPARNKKPLLMLIVALLVVAAAAAYFLVLKPSGDAPAEEVTEEVELGEVLPVEPVSLNLADGRYLRLGIALQLTAEVEEEVDTARALDAAISLFSGRAITEVTDPAVRDGLVAELAKQLDKTYHGEVVDVYLTEYVTQ